MICLRCGYCCIQYVVPIVDDPQIGINENQLDENNITIKPTNQPCKHLIGNEPGKYECAIHQKSWFHLTPCAKHAQIERHPETPCRLGSFIIKNHLNKKKAEN